MTVQYAWYYHQLKSAGCFNGLQSSLKHGLDTCTCVQSAITAILNVSAKIQKDFGIGDNNRGHRDNNIEYDDAYDVNDCWWWWRWWWLWWWWWHYSDVIMSAMASQITGVSKVWVTVCSGAYQGKQQSKLRVTGLCVRYRLPSQMASNAENISLWWRHNGWWWWWWWQWWWY